MVQAGQTPVGELKKYLPGCWKQIEDLHEQN